MSRIVKHNGTIYLCGQVCEDAEQGIKGQTESMLEKVDTLLEQAGSDKKHILNLGWIADCAYGIAGAFVVFLILPTELDTQNSNPESLLIGLSLISLIKLIALSIVGGYGGRSLVDRALSNIIKDVEEAKEEAKEANQKIKQIQDIDTLALELTNLQLDDGEEEQDLQKLKESIMKASKAARFEIFKEARIVREANWKENVSLMERTIPIFEALIENESGEKYHRNYGQLGYALKDQGGKDETKKDWKRAYDELSAAINLRNKEGKDGFLMYEFNRAICGIKLGFDKKEIIADIKYTAKKNTLHEIMKKMTIFENWANANNFDLEKLI